MESLREIWNFTLESLRTEYSETTMLIFFNDLKLIDMNETTATIESENEFKRDMIDRRYRSTLEKHLSGVLGFKITINFVAAEPEPEVEPEQELEEKKPFTATNITETGAFRANSFKYTFETFIVGSSNNFAHAACIAVANNPAYDYNPLFIYGSSGLGKTHLLYAITDRIKKTRPEMKIIYVKGEEFTNEMIESISRGTASDFREKYRKADVLLIDDIQFIAGRESTQEEFFHTFNALYEEHKQIIMTSDKPPRDMKTLEDRLKTRFEWGIIADIQPPDYELRIAIMKNKADMLGLTFPNDVLSFLAENLKNNVRQLEGAIKKIGAQSFLNGQVISVDLARICIADLLTGTEPVKITVEKILERVSNKYGVSVEEIKGRKRTKDIALARHICIYLIRRLTDASFPTLGKIFSRDHSTIISSQNLIDNEIKNNSIFELEIENLIKEIKE